jgi:hypothetical protein
VSSNELTEWARNLTRRVVRVLILDEPIIDQAPDLVGVVRRSTRGNNAAHAIPVEGRQLQPALIPEVDEGVIEPDVADHGDSAISLCQFAYREIMLLIRMPDKADLLLKARDTQ